MHYPATRHIPNDYTGCKLALSGSGGCHFRQTRSRPSRLLAPEQLEVKICKIRSIGREAEFGLVASATARLVVKFKSQYWLVNNYIKPSIRQFFLQQWS